jgi:hypothetical protein
LSPVAFRAGKGRPDYADSQNLTDPWIKFMPEILYKAIIILFMIFIFGSLTSGLYFLVRDRGTTTRAVKSLTVRISLSVVLFLLLMLGFATGILKPTGLPQQPPPEMQRALQ